MLATLALLLAAAASAQTVSTSAAVVAVPAAPALPAAQAAPQRPFSAPGDDLSGIVLGPLNLSRRDFTRARLTRARLRGTRLSGARLRAAVLDQAVVEGVDLTEADLVDADLRGTRFSSSILARADLRGADLRGTDLSGADLKGARLARARYDDATRLPFSRPEAFRRGLLFFGRRLPPFDESAADVSFKLFKLALSSAVARRDSWVVSARLSKGLRKQCYKNRKFSCWAALSAALSGGGLFTDERFAGFWAPYDAALWPSVGREDLTGDPAALALAAGKVEARGAPAASAPAQATLADELVVVTSEQGEWRKVSWPGGEGWVRAGRLRFPARESRVWFGKQGDEWKVVEIAPVPPQAP